jgi:hypothetical protein
LGIEPPKISFENTKLAPRGSGSILISIAELAVTTGLFLVPALGIGVAANGSRQESWALSRDLPP